MSRLADRLMGMDRGSRPIGQGWIPGLAPPAAPSRKWRTVLALVILLCMAVAAAAFITRPRSPAAPVAAGPAPVVKPAVKSGVTPEVAPAPAPAHPAPSAAVAQTLSLAREAVGRGDLADAARLFRDALRARPDDSEAWNDLGVIRVRQGDLVGGTDAFRQALQREARHVEARRNLAVALDRRGRRQEAEEQYRRFLEAAPAAHPAIEDVRRRLQELGAFVTETRP